MSVQVRKSPKGYSLRVRCFGSTMHWKQEVADSAPKREDLRGKVIALIESLPLGERLPFVD